MEPIAPAKAAWKNLVLTFEAISFIWSMSDPNINSTESCKVSRSLGNWPLDFIFAVDGRLMFIRAFFKLWWIWRYGLKRKDGNQVCHFVPKQKKYFF